MSMASTMARKTRGAVQVSGFRDRGGQAGQRLGLLVGVCDGAGDGLGAVRVSSLRDRGHHAAQRPVWR